MTVFPPMEFPSNLQIAMKNEGIRTKCDRLWSVLGFGLSKLVLKMYPSDFDTDSDS